MLLILDCCAAGGANLRSLDWQPSRHKDRFAKHLFAACGFESSSRGDMSATLCDVLSENAEDNPPELRGRSRLRSRSGDASQKAAGGLTTKRLHQIMEDRLQKESLGSQPIFKQLLPADPEMYITLPNFNESWY
jgi:hypothetical protein